MPIDARIITYFAINLWRLQYAFLLYVIFIHIGVNTIVCVFYLVVKPWVCVYGADIDECAQGLDNCKQKGGDCVNTPGSFTCGCGPYRNEKDGICVGEAVSFCVCPFSVLYLCSLCLRFVFLLLPEQFLSPAHT